jgi:hypothetical protein
LILASISSLVSTSNQILWNRPDFPASLTDPEEELFSFIGRGSIYGRVMPRQRFFQYLPLCFNKLYTSGLTVYWHGNGIVGLEAHFKEALSLYCGSRNGVALYYPFSPGERVSRIWLRIIPGPSYLFAAPSLLVSSKAFSQALTNTLHRSRQRWGGCTLLAHISYQDLFWKTHTNGSFLKVGVLLQVSFMNLHRER